MDSTQKKKAAAAVGGGLAAVFVGVALHPIVLPALAAGGAYAGFKAIKNKKKGGPSPE